MATPASHRIGTLALVACLASPPARAATAGDGAVLACEFVFEEAPFAECHASTIAEADGGLVAAWFAGPYEKHREVGIWVSRREGGRWSPPVEVADGVQYRRADGGVHRYPCWNPVLFQPRRGAPGGPSGGALLLFYKCGPSPSSWWGVLAESPDGGRTWSPPHRLPEGIYGPIKNKPFELEDGTIVCGSSTEHAGWRIHFERTRDLGRTWERTEALNDGKAIGAIQPCILNRRGDRLVALGRSREGRIWRSSSDDGGRTWSALSLTDLPNPNSGIDAVTLADGRHVLVYNHTTSARTPLNVAVSEDAETWRAALVLETEPGEYSYPAAIQARDGTVHVTYTWRRKRIRHVAIDPAKLELRDFVEGRWPEGAPSGEALGPGGGS